MARNGPLFVATTWLWGDFSAEVGIYSHRLVEVIRREGHLSRERCPSLRFVRVDRTQPFSADPRMSAACRHSTGSPVNLPRPECHARQDLRHVRRRSDGSPVRWLEVQRESLLSVRQPKITRATTRRPRVSVVRRSTVSTIARHALDLLFLSAFLGDLSTVRSICPQRLATFNGSDQNINLSMDVVNTRRPAPG
jgi:hypothetical protein